MPVEKENTSFLLRRIPKDLWGKVKHKAYAEGNTVRDLILNLLEKDTKTWQEKKTETEK